VSLDDLTNIVHFLYIFLERRLGCLGPEVLDQLPPAPTRPLTKMAGEAVFLIVLNWRIRLISFNCPIFESESARLGLEMFLPC
jgi:hypothetical protein